MGVGMVRFEWRGGAIMNTPAANSQQIKPGETPEFLEMLGDLIECDAEAGTLVWKRRPDSMFLNSILARIWNARFAGQRALNTITDGYPHGCILKKHFRAHRVIWAMAHGRWPVDVIDHINRIRWDNRISNLREATKSENSRNSSLNSSGARGVYWNGSNKKWRATIKFGDEQVHLGYFSQRLDALIARKAAQEKIGFYPTDGEAA